MSMDFEDLSDFQHYPDGKTWELHITILNSSGMNVTIEGNATVRQVDTFNVVQKPWLMVIICTLYCIIFVCGIFGNGLVSFVVIRNKAMHTVTNSFIASLAMNDIVICALTVPLTPLYTFLEGWYFGSFMCNLFALIQASSIFVSTITLTVIAVERFFVICFPYLPKLTTKSALYIILAIWVLSFGICTPYAVFMKFHDGIQSMGPRCDEGWPNPTIRLTFGTVSLIVQYSIPLVVITSSYVCIWVKLRLQASKGLASSQRGREPTALLRKRRTNRMLIGMVIIFGCCWLPLNLVNILNDYFPQTITGWEYFVLVFFVSHIVAVSSTCYNPILYAWMNENFRKEFKAVLPCFSATSRDGSVRRHHSTIIYDKSGYDKSDRNGRIYEETESTFMHSVTPKLMRKNASNLNNGLEKVAAATAVDETANLLQVPSYAKIAQLSPRDEGKKGRVDHVHGV